MCVSSTVGASCRFQLQTPSASPTLPALLQVVVVDHSAHGVDLPEDVASLEAIMLRQATAAEPSVSDDGSLRA